MFKFKTPSKKTLEIMAEAAKGNEDYEAKCIEKIRQLTSHEEVKITSSGTTAFSLLFQPLKETSSYQIRADGTDSSKSPNF